MNNKGKYSAEYIIKNKDELIKKRKKRIKRRRGIVIIIILLCILCTLAVKLPYFNVTEFKLLGNKNLSQDQASTIYNKYLGQNIFLLRKQKIEERLKENQYVEDVEVKKILPNKINISVKERRASYFINNDKLYIIDYDGIILERSEQLNNKSLIEVTGFGNQVFSETEVGFSKRQQKVLKEFHELCKANKSNIKFSKIDIGEITNINVFFNNLTIKLGTEYNMKEKLNQAINIIEAHNISEKTGYIDVSFKGSSVVNVD